MKKTVALTALAAVLLVGGCTSAAAVSPSSAPTMGSASVTMSAREAASPDAAPRAGYRLMAPAPRVHHAMASEVKKYEVTLQVETSGVYADIPANAMVTLDPAVSVVANYAQLPAGKYRVLATAYDVNNVKLNAAPDQTDFNLSAGQQANAAVTVELDDIVFSGTLEGGINEPTTDGVFADPAATETVGQ